MGSFSESASEGGKMDLSDLLFLGIQHECDGFSVSNVYVFAVFIREKTCRDRVYVAADTDSYMELRF